jgi:hypothetical protein
MDMHATRHVSPSAAGRPDAMGAHPPLQSASSAYPRLPPCTVARLSLRHFGLFKAALSFDQYRIPELSFVSL